MPDFAEYSTANLDLRPMVVADAVDLFVILSDPDGWWYEPDGRHTELTTTRGFAERAAARWQTDGLSYWTVRSGQDGAVIGLGGVQRHRSGAWNLSYRIATSHQGNGYATELAISGITAAHDFDPDSAVIAWVLDHNAPSRRVAERVGLTNYGPRTDTNDGMERLAFADRPI